MEPVPMRSNTHRSIVVLAVAAAWMVLSFGRARGGQPADGVVNLQVDAATTFGTIPGDFVGLGYETSATKSI
jgi:hypothetical protein